MREYLREYLHVLIGLFTGALAWVLYAPITALMPGLQIWFMLLAQHMGWWPERGIILLDWFGALLVPCYAVMTAVFL